MKKYLALSLALALCMSLPACGSPAKDSSPPSTSSPTTESTQQTTVPEYAVINESEYARNGKSCIGYRVEVADGTSEEDMRSIFDDVTDDDGYYLHTVWFYGLASDVENVGSYTVGMLEEEAEDSSPVFSAPLFSQADIEKFRS